jgi:restriction system protein
VKLPQNSLFAVLMRTRWWVSALVALGVFALTRLILPQGFALFASLPFIVIAAVVAWKEIRHPRGARLHAALEKLRALRWVVSAAGLVAGYGRAGYRVKRAEGAADFELEKDGRVALVGARRWKAARTGAEPLRELLAAAAAREAGTCLYVCAGEITDTARSLATEKKIRLVEGLELAKLAGVL